MFWRAVVPLASVACTVKLKVPATVVAPLSTPVESSVNDAGRVPLTTSQVYGATPPVAVSVCGGYATPTSAFGSEAGDVIVNGAGLTWMEHDRVVLLLAASSTRKTNGKVPGVVGTPVITAFGESSVRPGGGASILQT